MKSIAVFNNKGGVGKTTLLCNLASYLALKLNKKVLVIDADPQCSATSYIFDEKEFLKVYLNDSSDSFTITDIIKPLEDGMGFVNCFKPIASKAFRCDIIPGNPRFAVSEDFLSQEWKDVISSDIRGIKSTLVFKHFLTLCQEYDYVFFDMSPSLGAINRSVLLACDYFILPVTSDIFNIMVLRNIGESIIKWHKVLNNGISALEEHKQAQIDKLYDGSRIKFLGYVENRFQESNCNSILEKLTHEIEVQLIKPLNDDSGDGLNYKLGSISNLSDKISISQAAHKPLFELIEDDTFSDLMSTIHLKLI